MNLRAIRDAIFARPPFETQGSGNWLVFCKRCGAKTPLNETGGIRYKAIGNKYQFAHCSACARWTWLLLYRDR